MNFGPLQSVTAEVLQSSFAPYSVTAEVAGSSPVGSVYANRCRQWDCNERASHTGIHDRILTPSEEHCAARYVLDFKSRFDLLHLKTKSPPSSRYKGEGGPAEKGPPPKGESAKNNSISGHWLRNVTECQPVFGSEIVTVFCLSLAVGVGCSISRQRRRHAAKREHPRLEATRTQGGLSFSAEGDMTAAPRSAVRSKHRLSNGRQAPLAIFVLASVLVSMLPQLSRTAVASAAVPSDHGSSHPS